MLVSTTAHVHVERVIAALERLGGPEARAVAERGFADPTPDDIEEWIRVCGPLYTQRPLPPEILARVTMRMIREFVLEESEQAAAAATTLSA